MATQLHLKDSNKLPRRAGLTRNWQHSLHQKDPRASSAQHHELGMVKGSTRASITVRQEAQTASADDHMSTPPSSSRSINRLGFKNEMKSKAPGVIDSSLSESDGEEYIRQRSESSDDETHSRRNDIIPSVFYNKSPNKFSGQLNGQPIHQPAVGSPKTKGKRKLIDEKIDDFGRLEGKKRAMISYGKSARTVGLTNSRRSYLLKPPKPKPEPEPSPENTPKKEYIHVSFSSPDNSPSRPCLPTKMVHNTTPKSQRLTACKPMKALQDESPSSQNRKAYVPIDPEPDTPSPFKMGPFRNPGLGPTSSPTKTLSAQSASQDDKPVRRRKPLEFSATQLAPFILPDDELDPDLISIVNSDIDTRGLSSSLTPLKSQEQEDLPCHQRRCPICKKAVDMTVFEEFGGMNTRQQEQFCRLHQRRTAQEDWSAKGYPDIDWSMLNQRLQAHHAFIRKLIGGSPCHYRFILDEKVRAGKERSLLKTTDNLIPGYYGSRGLRAISENIMEKFTSVLKMRAPKDRLIAARGPAAFVQSVCVPEVATLLIAEDMDVNAEEARQILRESSQAGELVNEEVREEVLKRVDDSEDDD